MFHVLMVCFDWMLILYQFVRFDLMVCFGWQAADPEREDFGHLAPQQQKKQLKERIKNIKHKISKENAGR